ncbi:MAG: nickel pincer cofactor biosynthesis protein LarC [Chloroflexota bacterium]|nr:nickel pincer cofactor biosynthesis protein LarC [Chloroflexota bacterium]
MTIAYFDCIAGASGDMILGALLDAGLPESVLTEKLAALHLKGFALRCQPVLKCGIRATKADVIVADDAPERRLSDIQRILAESSLSSAVRERAGSIFRRLCEVEAGIHGTSMEEVHLHELGGLDTIVDVVGCLVGLEALGVDRIFCSPLPLGRGMSRGSHGRLPLPAPATVALLKGVPVTGTDIEMELVTPTGAALLATLAESFGQIPAMTITATGYGAGTRDLPIPNVLRLLLGEAASPGRMDTQTLALLETNMDDMNPELYDYVMTRLFQAGALDVFLSPIQMKKNRPATLLHVLCRPEHAPVLTQIIFAETTTLGVRQMTVMRQALARSIQSLETPYGPIRVKVACLASGGAKAAPEYEDCRRAAEKHGIPLRQVYHAAERAAEALVR